MINIYHPGTDDWSSNGLAILLPTECRISEEAGGSYEMTLTHPISDDLRWKTIAEGCIIKVPVPACETPGINLVKAGIPAVPEVPATPGNPGTPYIPAVPGVPGRIIYKVNITTTGANGISRIYEKPTTTDSKKVDYIRNGQEYEYLGQHSASWHKAVGPKGIAGYMYTANSEYVRTEAETGGSPAVPEVPATPETPGIPATPAVPGYSTVVKARQIRTQLFRVYRVDLDTEKNVIKAFTRHISYDLMANVTGKLILENVPMPIALERLKASLFSAGDVNLITNMPTTISGEWQYENGIKVLLDPEEGFVSKTRCKIIRDNNDIFMLANSAYNRGVSVKHGKNLNGVDWSKSVEDVITRIVPLGEDAEGNNIVLPEKYIDSQYINYYPVIYTQKLDVPEAKVKEAKGDDPGMTLEQAYTAMRDAAQAEFDKGCDAISFDLDVDFIQLGDTEEYKQYHDLQQVFLYDAISISHDPTGLTARGQVKSYEWDAILNRYTKVGIGDVFEISGGGIAGYQLPNGGIAGYKLIPGSVGGNQLRDLSVMSAKIGLAQIDTAHIKLAAIESANIKDAAITTAKIQDATITNAKIAAAGIDFAKVRDLSADTSIFRLGVGGNLYLDRLVVNDANFASAIAGKLMIRDDNGKLYRISIGENGAVTSTLVQLDGDSLTENAVMSISQRLLWRQATAPSAPFIGMLWQDTTKDQLKRCISTSPLVWEIVPAGRVHTNVIDVDDNGMNILTGGDLNLLAGSNINIKNLGNTDNVINMDSTGLTLSSTGQLKLQSTDSIIIGGSPFSVGGTNLLTDSATERTSATEYLPVGIYPVVQQRIGQTITVSADIKASIAGTILMYSLGTDIGFNLPCDCTTEYKRFSATGILGADAGWCDLSFYGTYGTGRIPTVKNIKIELGSIATDWSPAPSDPASGVKTASITISDGGIDLTASNKITVNGGEFIATKANSVTTEARDSIVSTVKNDSDWLGKGAAASTYSTITQTNDNITIAVGNIHVGGTNLIAGSATIAVGDIASASEYQSITILNPIAPGTYTFSVERFYRAVGGGGTLSDNGTLQIYSDTAYQLFAIPGNTQIKQSVTFTVPDDASTYRVLLYAGTVGDTQYEYWNWYNVKLEKGTMATDWSPAPSDPASGVKTSYIDIATDHIDISTGGTFTVASNNFKIDAAGNVTMTGKVTAATGNIGDFTLDSGHLVHSDSSSGYFADISKWGAAFGQDASPPNYQFPVRITSQAGSLGHLVAKSGRIGALDFDGSAVAIKNGSLYGTKTTKIVLYDDGNIKTVGSIWAKGAIYCPSGTVTAGTFSDFTKGYDGDDALAEIKQIKNKSNGDIDHSTLPASARIVADKKRTTQQAGEEDIQFEESTEDQRDIGAMVSVLTKAVQELTEIIEAQNIRIAKLEEKKSV